MILTAQNSSVQQAKLLDEIIDNAIELPIGSQNLLLMMAKAMQYTHNCMKRQSMVKQSKNSPETNSA